MYLVAGSARTWEQAVAAAALAAGLHTRADGGAVGAASHRSALRLFGFRSVDSDVDVSVVYPRRLSLPDVRIVRSRDLVAEDITFVDGIPVTVPERTICDSGLIFPEHEVMRMLRHGISTGLISRRDTTQMRMRISEHGRTGAGVIGRCLEALPDLAEEVESGLEVMFLEMCDEYGLPHPAIQLPVVANGRSYRLDFAYPADRIFVEIDGSHHDEPRQISKDGGRQNDLIAHGWLPIRFTYRQLLGQSGYCASVLLQALSRIPQSVNLRP